MTPEQRDELRRLCDEATPPGTTASEQFWRDAEFMAAARSVVPGLLDALEAADKAHHATVETWERIADGQHARAERAEARLAEAVEALRDTTDGLARCIRGEASPPKQFTDALERARAALASTDPEEER